MLLGNEDDEQQLPPSFIPDLPPSFVPDSDSHKVTGNSDDIDSGTPNVETSGHSSFLDSFSDTAKSFLKNHPLIKKVYDEGGNLAHDAKSHIDSFIGNHLDELAEKKSGVLNPNPNDNPLMGKSFLPEANGATSLLGRGAQGIYNSVLRPIASPLGIVGGIGGEDIPKEPIPAIADVMGSTEEHIPINMEPSAPISNRPDLAPIGGEADFNASRPQLEPNKSPEELGYEGALNKGNGPESVNDVAAKLSPSDQAAMRDADSAATASRPSLMEPHSLMGQVPSEFSTMADEDVSKSLAPNQGLSKELPQLSRVVDEGGTLQLGFHDKVSEDQIKNMFPGQDVSISHVQGSPIFDGIRKNNEFYKVTFWNKSGSIDYKASATAKDSLGGHLYEAQPSLKPEEPPSNTQLSSEPKSLLEAQTQGENSKPPLDVISNAPQRAEKPEDVLLPAPGQATPRKDINNFRATFGSADRTLMSRPESKGVVEPIIEANDSKLSFIASTQRQLASVTGGLNKAQRLMLSDGIEGKIEGEVPPELVPRIQKAREILNHIFGLAGMGDKDINYMENYLTHIEGIPDEDMRSAISSIFDYHLGNEHPLAKLVRENPVGELFKRDEYIPPTRSTKGGDAALYDKGLGDPDSVFRKTRLDSIQSIERDPNKIFPAYVESIAKLIYDSPAVEKAKIALKNLPEVNTDGTPNKLKDLAKAYIKNYTRYDSLPGLNDAWRDFANSMNRTTSRSMLGFSTGLQSLHAARIVGNLWPELGSKYTAYGLGQVAKNPIAAYGEATRLGLLQGQIRPWAFQTKMERFDAVSNFLGAADFLDKAIGYHGFKKMFMDQGVSEGQASLKALAATKKASLTSDPARAILGFNESGASGAAMKMAGLYKTVPIKMVEQYMDLVTNAKNNPQAAARAVTGVGLLLAGATEGAHVFHLNPSQFALQMGGAFGSVMGKIANDIYVKKDWKQAVQDTALWATPGGMSLKRQYENGPSAIDSGKPVKKLKFIS